MNTAESCGKILLEHYEWLRAAPMTVRDDEIQIPVAADAPGRLPELYAFLRRRFKAHFSHLFASDERPIDGMFGVYYVFSSPSEQVFFVIRLAVSPAIMEIPSISGTIPAALWFEQEMNDWFGIFSFPNVHRLAVHPDWPSGLKELRKDFDPGGVVERSKGGFEFHRVEGEGIFEIPVGPVHAGIIEPGHFRFSVAGEPIINLETQLFYTHKGTEKLAEGLPPHRVVHLAERISGDSSFAHAVAFCHGIERIGMIEAPPRANIIRTMLLELERLFNHIGDTGAILLDVGFSLGASQASQLKERMLHLNEILTGSRLLRGMAAIGGVKHEIIPDRARQDLINETLIGVRTDFDKLMKLIMSSTSVLDRLETTGRLKQSDVYRLGVVGIAARASGVARDFRKDHPHCAYPGLAFRTVVHQEGDVFARLKVRIDEVVESFNIIDQLLARQTDGSLCNPMPVNVPMGHAHGYAEGWRGEILHWIMTDGEGKIYRWHITDPSFHNWRALEAAVRNNIVPDFPVINKSFNLSYSGNDR